MDVLSIELKVIDMLFLGQAQFEIVQFIKDHQFIKELQSQESIWQYFKPVFQSTIVPDPLNYKFTQENINLFTNLKLRAQGEFQQATDEKIQKLMQRIEELEEEERQLKTSSKTPESGKKLTQGFVQKY